MRIICSGFMSSGTKLLTAVVRELVDDREVWHTSLPSGPAGLPEQYRNVDAVQWWSDQVFPESQFIVIRRHQDVCVRSIMARNDLPAVPKDPELLYAWYWRAQEDLGRLKYAYRVEYELLVSDTQRTIEGIAAWLGVEYRPMPFDIYDADKKWLEQRS